MPTPIKWISLLAGGILLAGCKTETTHAAETSTNPPPIVVAPTPAPPSTNTISASASAPAAAGVAPANAPALEAVASATMAASAGTNAVAGGIASTNAPPPLVVARPALSHWTLELVKLVESGAEDSVLLAFIQNVPVPFGLRADEIVYLTDIGVSDEVLTAMINHRGAGNPPGADEATNIAEALPAAPPVEAAPAPVTYEEAPPQIAYVNQPAVTYFYSSLAPYGSWVDLPGYGYCWQPTVALRYHNWRPYCDRGRWIYSDCGWYWHSDYSWGWAPFHYGRWFHHSGRGWCWAPDNVWGPAWVNWRYSRDYCGWAPLPPGSHYTAGVGLTFHSRNVSVGFGFGLTSRDYTFVPSHRFYDRSPWRHAVHGHQSTAVYNNTTVINNYIRGANNTIINEGIGRDRVVAMTRSEIRKAPIRDIQEAHGTPIRSEKLVREGDHVAIYRPRPVGSAAVVPSRASQEVRGAVPSRVVRGGSTLIPSTSTRTPSESGRPLPAVSGRAELNRPVSTASGGVSRTFPGTAGRAPENQALATRQAVGSRTEARNLSNPSTTGAPAASQPARRESVVGPRSVASGQNNSTPSRGIESVRQSPSREAALNSRVAGQTRPSPAAPQQAQQYNAQRAFPTAPQQNFASRPAVVPQQSAAPAPSRQEPARPSYNRAAPSQSYTAPTPSQSAPARSAPAASYSPTRQQPSSGRAPAGSYQSGSGRQAPAVQSAPAQFSRQPPSAPRSAPSAPQQSSSGGRSYGGRSESR